MPSFTRSYSISLITEEVIESNPWFADLLRCRRRGPASALPTISQTNQLQRAFCSNWRPH